MKQNRFRADPENSEFPLPRYSYITITPPQRQQRPATAVSIGLAADDTAAKDLGTCKLWDAKHLTDFARIKERERREAMKLIEKCKQTLKNKDIKVANNTLIEALLPPSELLKGKSLGVADGIIRDIRVRSKIANFLSSFPNRLANLRSRLCH